MRKKEYHKKFSVKTKLWIMLACFVTILVFILLFFNFYVNPVIIEISEATVKSMTSKSVNSAVQTIINNTNLYDDIIQINTDAEGNITSFQVKSVLINRLGKDIGKTAQQNLEMIGSEGIEIPLGTLTGIPHRIYMNVTASVSMVLPTASRNITTNTQILLCESIIVGKVPDTYLNSNSLDEMMNLIPD